MQDSAGPHFVLSGYSLDTSPGAQGTDGYYWSSSAYTSATYAYSLRLNGTNSTVYPAYNGNKRSGFSLRCLGKKINRYQKTLEKIVEVSYNYIITTPD